ncbi:SDR family NAD(P)-dependent oxidoreductase [Maricurvus nonylphenolicus]|uniref:SDR family NAD(P)-dependent oxidoreductase n=1 Tax=Maricurvus nonylphenolicus TaxID=1008307 RepID=UPI0036F361FF
MKTFHRRVAVITGAGSGIGQALAVQLAQQGCAVALADKNLDALKLTREMVQDQDGRCSIHELDVSDLTAVKAFADTVHKEFGSINMLFNNAGVTLMDTVANQSIDDINWLMNINFWGVVYCTQVFLPYILDAEDAHIINVSSIFGMVAVPGNSAYNASKFAVRGYTEALRHEYMKSHLNVTCVLPGGVKTGIINNAKFKTSGLAASKAEMEKRFQSNVKTTPEQAAQQILNGVLKNKARVIIGKDAKIMDFVARLFPTTYYHILGIERRANSQQAPQTNSAIG